MTSGRNHFVGSRSEVPDAGPNVRDPYSGRWTFAHDRSPAANVISAARVARLLDLSSVGRNIFSPANRIRWLIIHSIRQSFDLVFLPPQ